MVNSVNQRIFWSNTHRKELQSNDLAKLESQEKPNEDGEVDFPQIAGIQSVAHFQIPVAVNDVASTLGTEKCAGLVGTKVISAGGYYFELLSVTCNTHGYFVTPNPFRGMMPLPSHVN